MSRKSSLRAGFTLVELLVVILILAILTSVALPLYNGTIKAAERRVARANMQTIANAVQSWHVQHPGKGYPAGAVQSGAPGDPMTDIVADLGSALSGPGQRTYTVLASGIQCWSPQQTADGVVEQQITIPDNAFAVASIPDPTKPTVDSGKAIGGDGCYIPGVSTE